MYTRTEGNPLFVTEVVRLLAQEGELSVDQAGNRDSWTARIPEGVREVIGRRLNSLSQRCNDALVVASVIGREFTLDQMKPLVEDMSEDRLLEVLEEALAPRIIEELPQVAGRYQFTHALIRDTLTEELTLTRRVRLHATIAETLERLYGENADAHAPELAHHFFEARSILETDRLVRYSLIAGEQALASYAYEEAISHFQRALAAKRGQETDAEKAALLFGLGRAQGAIFGQNLEEAGSTLVHAFEFYARAGDIDQAVKVAEYPLDPYPGTRTGKHMGSSRALDFSQPGSPQAGRLSSRLARVLAIEEGEYEAAEKAFATAIAGREGDASLEMQTLANAAQSELNQLRFRQSLELTVRSIALAPRAKEYRAEALAHHMAGMSLIALGDPVSAQKHASSLLTLAEQLRNRYFISSASGTKAMAAGLVGNWNDARRFGDESLTVAPMDPRTLGLRIMVEYEVGNFDWGETFLERLLETMRTTSQSGSIANAFIAFVLPAISRLNGVADRLEAGEQTAHAVISSRSATPLLIHAAETGLALLAIQRDSASAAWLKYAVLASTRASIPTIVFTSCDRILGLLAQTMGSIAKACEHFEDSLSFCRKSGYRPEFAWTGYDYADTLIKRNNAGDRSKAITLLDQCLTISSDLGMRLLMERATNLRGEMGSAPTKAPMYPDGITAREAEVLRLVAEGKSNPNIATDLFISLNTVARHISNIFAKTGCSSRSEAAAYAVRQGLG